MIFKLFAAVFSCQVCIKELATHFRMIFVYVRAFVKFVNADIVDLSVL